MALTPRTVHATREKSPTANANRKFAAPAAVTCHPVELNTSMPDCQRLESTDPRAQEKTRIRAVPATRSSATPARTKQTVPPSPAQGLLFLVPKCDGARAAANP